MEVESVDENSVRLNVREIGGCTVHNKAQHKAYSGCIRGRQCFGYLALVFWKDGAHNWVG